MRAKVGQFASHLLKVALEPNSDASSAVVITALKAGESRVFSGVMADATDVDVFKVSATSGTTMTVDIDAKTLSPASTLDSFVRIFDSSGTQLAFNDDSGGTTDSLATLSASTTGDFYIGVSAYKNQTYDVISGDTGLSQGTTTGPYLVKISFA